MDGRPAEDVSAIVGVPLVIVSMPFVLADAKLPSLVYE